MKIAAYGFSQDQINKLGRILKLSRTNPYSLVEFDPCSLPDLLLIFGDDRLQQTAITQLPRGYQSRLIVVGKVKPTSDDRPRIGYPLISSRVLQALDQLTSANEESNPDHDLELPVERDTVEENHSDAESLDNKYQKYVALAAQQEASQNVADPEYRVLVVDDSLPMQKALANELRSQFDTIEIDFADAGAPALDMVKAQHYDFIFLDIMMPGIDGFETCTQMRKLDALKKTPIIMLSSKTSPLDEVKGIMAGSSTYLTKPIVSVEFQKVMGRICKWVDNYKASA